MSFEHIIYEKSGAVATITLNLPEMRNALTLPLREELGQAIHDVAADPGVRALLITGAGAAFSAGGDVKRMGQGMGAMETRLRVHKIMMNGVIALMTLEKPVVAAVNGPAIGAGMNLALACDIVYAAEEATFSQRFVRIGAIPDNLGFYLLPRLVGLQRTKDLMFTGKIIDAREAERLGLVTRVLPRDEVLPAARALAEELASGPTQTIALTKVLIHRSLSLDLAGVLELEAMGQAIINTTDDRKEGIRAFVEKRAPTFRGQ